MSCALLLFRARWIRVQLLVTYAEQMLLAGDHLL